MDFLNDNIMEFLIAAFFIPIIKIGVTFIRRKIKESKILIRNIENEQLKDVVRRLIQYAYLKLDNAEGTDKMDFVIRKAQELTPDIVISDNDLKLIAESIYFEFKKELKELKDL
jgi:hypothetical protein